MKLTQQLILVSLSAGALMACSGGSSSNAVVDIPAVPPASAVVSTGLSVTPVTATNTTVLTVTIKNTGTKAVSGGAFSIPLPAGPASTNAVSPSAPCSSSGFNLGSGKFALTGVSVPAGATCTNTITLTPSTAGSHVFTPTGLTNFTAGTTATLVIQ